MKSQKSAIEYELEQILYDIELKIGNTSIDVRKAQELLNLGWKAHSKCEELRKSRDNWKTKYEELKKQR